MVKRELYTGNREKPKRPNPTINHSIVVVKVYQKGKYVSK